MNIQTLFHELVSEALQPRERPIFQKNCLGSGTLQILVPLRCKHFYARVRNWVDVAIQLSNRLQDIHQIVVMVDQNLGLLARKVTAQGHLDQFFRGREEHRVVLKWSSSRSVLKRHQEMLNCRKTSLRSGFPDGSRPCSSFKISPFRVFGLLTALTVCDRKCDDYSYDRTGCLEPCSRLRRFDPLLRDREYQAEDQQHRSSDQHKQCGPLLTT